MYIFFVSAASVCGVLALWALCGWLVVRHVKEPAYTVTERHKGYELRSYAPYIVAETRVRGASEREALTRGFRLVADYIFGNNTRKESITMTAPVLSESQSGEKISMTAPVLSTQSGDSEYTIAFVMPATYSAVADLPIPNSEKIALRTIAARVVAVRSFSWYATNARIAEEKRILMTMLTADRKQVTGTPGYAGYTPPLTAPFMQRHEVFVPLS